MLCFSCDSCENVSLSDHAVNLAQLHVKMKTLTCHVSSRRELQCSLTSLFPGHHPHITTMWFSDLLQKNAPPCLPNMHIFLGLSCSIYME